MDKVQKSTNDPLWILYPSVAILFSACIVYFFICSLLSQCYLEYDSTITEAGICVDTTYHPVEVVPADTEQIYFCGKLEGTTPNTGTLYLFYQNKVIYKKVTLDLQLGLFYLPIPRRVDLEVGDYKIEIHRVRKIIAETTFKVVP